MDEAMLGQLCSILAVLSIMAVFYFTRPGGGTGSI